MVEIRPSRSHEPKRSVLLHQRVRALWANRWGSRPLLLLDVQPRQLPRVAPARTYRPRDRYRRFRAGCKGWLRRGQPSSRTFSYMARSHRREVDPMRRGAAFAAMRETLPRRVRAESLRGERSRAANGGLPRPSVRGLRSRETRTRVCSGANRIALGANQGLDGWAAVLPLRLEVARRKRLRRLRGRRSREATRRAEHQRVAPLARLAGRVQRRRRWRRLRIFPLPITEIPDHLRAAACPSARQTGGTPPRLLSGINRPKRST